MEQWAILKTLSGSSPIFALSIHTTLSQTQTGATVPLTICSREQVKIFSTYMCFRQADGTDTFRRKIGTFRTVGLKCYAPISET